MSDVRKDYSEYEPRTMMDEHAQPLLDAILDNWIEFVGPGHTEDDVLLETAVNYRNLFYQAFEENDIHSTVKLLAELDYFCRLLAKDKDELRGFLQSCRFAFWM